MEGWLDEAAAVLGEPALDPDEVRLVLLLARDVAHGVERKMAPLAAYLAGAAAGRSAAAGTGGLEASDRLAALRRVVAILEPSQPSEDGGGVSREASDRAPNGRTDGSGRTDG